MSPDGPYRSSPIIGLSQEMAEQQIEVIGETAIHLLGGNDWPRHVAHNSKAVGLNEVQLARIRSDVVKAIHAHFKQPLLSTKSEQYAKRVISIISKTNFVKKFGLLVNIVVLLDRDKVAFVLYQIRQQFVEYILYQRDLDTLETPLILVEDFRAASLEWMLKQDAVRKRARRAEAEENEKPKIVGMKLTAKYREAMQRRADEMGYSLSEFMRRAVFAAIEDPSILKKADDLESSYRAGLGPSRWHK